MYVTLENPGQTTDRKLARLLAESSISLQAHHMGPSPWVILIDFVSWHVFPDFISKSSVNGCAQYVCPHCEWQAIGFGITHIRSKEASFASILAADGD